MFKSKPKSLASILGVFEKTASELEQFVADKSAAIADNRDKIAALSKEVEADHAEQTQAYRVMNRIKEMTA